jgi:methyl-accepting chemotaxis protein
MAKNLRLGSSFIRYSLIAGFISALVGAYFSSAIMTASPDNAVVKWYAGVLMAILLIIALLFVLVIGMLAARNLVKKVNILAAAMNRGAEGDLTATVQVSSEDEIGTLSKAFNLMLEKLAAMTNRVSRSSGELRRIVADLSDVSKQGLNAAEIQSASVEATSTGVQEITHYIEEVGEWVETLSKAAADNSSSIMEMSSSIAEVSQHVEALARAVEDVSSSIIQMTATEKEIGSHVDSLMQESTTTAALVAEMDSSIKQVGENAAQTASISEKVRNDAEIGREAVNATISGINEIRNSYKATAESIDSLSQRTFDIGKILSVIDEVAEQTNLLALNASIIAAQAGEHGKGFAVVADEIKDLAKRTSNSTREIAEIIKGVQEETRKVAVAIKQSEKRIVEGEALSQRSGEALQMIVEGVQMATSQVDTIAFTTVEQGRSSQYMRDAMERVASMVRQIANATREQGHGSELIMSAAERMRDLTGYVRISSQEQSNAGNLIVRSTEEITSMIGNIRQACAAEAASSQRIVQAVTNIEVSAKGTVEASQVMDRAISGLSQQIEELQEGMAGFKH